MDSGAPPAAASGGQTLADGAAPAGEWIPASDFESDGVDIGSGVCVEVSFT